MQTLETMDGTLEYRITGTGRKAVVIFPGGHMDASIKLGEDFFVKQGYKAIVVSRPGYGKTSLAMGPSPDEFADSIAKLLADLGIKQAVALGISAGGRSAVRLAAKYPNLIQKLILQSATSFMTWPGARTRYIARIAFSPRIQKITWRTTRWFLKHHPRAGLKMMLASMTTLDPSKVIQQLTSEQHQKLIRSFSSLQSDEGFINDLKQITGSAKDVRVPTLIIHSKYDKSVGLNHAQKLHQEIADSQLYLSDAESHMIWFSNSYKEIQKIMKHFLEES